MPIKLKHYNTPIDDLYIIKRNPVKDERGYLERLFCSSELDILMGETKIKQINRTLTKNHGSVRGLHFQYPPYAEKKIITCIKGSVFDIAIDLRKNSSTFLQYHYEILSDDNLNSFIIPEGFAHGFQTLTNDVEMLYLHSNIYNKEFEGALNINDPMLGIILPETISDISHRDESHPFLDKSFTGIEL
jgi:dTDP-4-dehydrorhamnose 3,5-epimerase